MSKKNNAKTVTSAEKMIPKKGVWNVLVYMAADNSLKEECVFALIEILKLGPLPEVDVIVQFDSGEAMTRYDFRKLRTFSKAKLSRLDLNDIAEVLISDPMTLQHVSDASMLYGFLRDTVGESDRNMVVLSGHGSGAVGDFLQTDNPPNSLSIPKLREVIEPIERQKGRKIDILGMDSCLMSMVEVCYQLHPHVDYLISAEGYQLNTGWPYSDILGLFKGKKQKNPDELAQLTLKRYIDYYSPYYISGVSVDLSVIDLSDDNKIKDMTAAINKLANLLRDNLHRPQIKNAVILAHWKAQSYKFEQYADLWDFCNLLAKDLQSGVYNIEEVKNLGQLVEGWDEIKKRNRYIKEVAKKAKEWESLRRSIEDACNKVMIAIDKIVPVTSYHGAAFQHSHGLSVYFPWSKTELEKNLPPYQNLAFADLTKWDEFLIKYVDETQRELRDDENLRARNVRPMSMSPSGPGNHRVNPLTETRVNPLTETRVNPLTETRVNPLTETRVNPLTETRVNPLTETRGKLLFAPDVKNPPTAFFTDSLTKKLRRKPR
jgi:hypothetical protein